MPPVRGACGHILEDNLSAIAPGVVRCPACDTLESLDGQKLQHRHGSLRLHARGEVLELSWSWSIPQTLMALWIGGVLLGVPTWAAVSGSGGSLRRPDLVEVEGLAGFRVLLAVAVALFFYRMLSRLVNRTTLRVGPQGLRTFHGPLPWFGGAHLPREALRHFHVLSRQDDFTLHELAVLGTDGKSRRLLVFNEEEPALRLAQALNARLAIPEHAEPQSEAEQAPAQERVRQV